MLDDHTLRTQQTVEPCAPSRSAADDLRVARGALERSPADVEELVVRMRGVPRLLVALNVRFGWPLDDSELADVAQDAVELAWRKLEHFNGTSSLETWFYGIARFELLNAARRKSRRGAGRRELAEHSRVASELSDSLELDSLRTALGTLPPDESRILWLHYFDGLSLADVARSTGAAVGTVKSRYYRALERMRGLLRGRAREMEG